MTEHVAHVAAGHINRDVFTAELTEHRLGLHREEKTASTKWAMTSETEAVYPFGFRLLTGPFRRGESGSGGPFCHRPRFGTFLESSPKCRID